MNSQTLGGLTSDQKIDKIFRVFGYSIPVAKDGRRLWPTKFKREMAQQMISGKLSITDVQRTCRVSESSAYLWKTKCGQRDKAAGKRKDAAFAELKVNEDKARDAQLQEPALPEVSGTGGARLDGGPRGGPAARRVFPRGVYVASRDRAHCALEQTGRLWPAIQGIGGNSDDHRR